MSPGHIARWTGARTLLAGLLLALVGVVMGPLTVAPPAVPRGQPTSPGEHPSIGADHATLRAHPGLESRGAGASLPRSAVLFARPALTTTGPCLGRIGSGRPGSPLATPARQPSSRGPPR